MERKDNTIMRKLILCLLFLSTEYYAMDEGYLSTNVNEKNNHGEMNLKQAMEYLEDRKYFSCIEKLNEFQILYPNHPSMMKSLQILSTAYKKLQKWDKVVEIELKLYKDYPETEEGLIAYLNAGKAYIRIGKEIQAKKIFEYIISKENTSKISKEAELELQLINLL